MGWRDHALRLLAQGLVSVSGEPFESRFLVRVFDEIAEDAERSARLDELDESGVRAELLARYEIARARD